MIIRWLIFGGICVCLTLTVILLSVFLKVKPSNHVKVVTNSNGTPVISPATSGLGEKRPTQTFNYSNATLVRGVDGGDPNYQCQAFSLAMSFDGSTLAIGAPWYSKYTGETYIFTKVSGVWTQQTILQVDGSGRMGYSSSLSADGSVCATGGPDTNGNVGCTWVFVRDSSNNWSQQAALTGSDTFASEQGFATALSYDGSTLAIGGYNYNNGIGAVWIFVNANGTWTEQTRVVPTDSIGTNVYFGYQLALSGDGNTLVAGGYLDSNGDGAVWVFRRNPISKVWTQDTKLHTPSEPGTNQGRRVAISGDASTIAYTAVIVDLTTGFYSGTALQNKLIGQTYVYTFTSKNVWQLLSGTQTNYIVPYGGAVRFNHDASILYVGDTFLNMGTLYVYARTDNSYTLQKSIPSNIAVYQFGGNPRFGYPIVTDGTGLNVAVGAPFFNKDGIVNFGGTFAYKIE